MNDLISRQAAIDALIAQANIDGAYGYISARDADIILDSLPSVQPEQKHGRWLSCATTDLMCSNCLHYWIPKGDQYDYHYCPNCGARMEGTE